MKVITPCPTTDNSGSTSVGRAKPKKASGISVGGVSTSAAKKAKTKSLAPAVVAVTPAVAKKKSSAVAVEAKAKPSAKKPAKQKSVASKTTNTTTAPPAVPSEQAAPESAFSVAVTVDTWRLDLVQLANICEVDLPGTTMANYTIADAEKVIEAARQRYSLIHKLAAGIKERLGIFGRLAPATTGGPANVVPAALPAERTRPRMAVIFDTETTGLIKNRQMPLDKQPEVIEFYGELIDLDTGKVHDQFEALIKPKVLPISDEIKRITGIDTDMVKSELPFHHYVYDIDKLLRQGDCVIAHNFNFDKDMLEIEYERANKSIKWPEIQLCTVQQTMSLKKYRLNLSALHQELFGEPFAGAHRAKADVQALTRCCVELRKRGVL